ncbi:MAG TPA: hypothetical protein VGN84_02175 [Solirubrobacterales bacterium]|jgi:hypothetical protein|nr:hypothetical protein [Solirubrobacterales bacterium]
MRQKRKTTRVVCMAMFAVALATLGLAGSASAFSAEFKKFEFCPYTNTEVKKCLYSVTNSGEVVLGNKKVPVEKPVTLQGGFGKPDEITETSKFYEATNGITLSKAAQAVPGGLLGIVPPEKSPALVKALSKFFFENSLTGVNSTLELAKPASEIKISEIHLSTREGVALQLPIKVHLENPFLGKSCYVGSSTSPIIWNLTTGITTPPGPNKSIEGAAGEIEFLEGGRILELKNDVLVDNAWSAPSAAGCGGILSFLVNPIINGQIGLPSTAGHNTAILKNTIFLSTAAAVKKDHTEHP